MRKLITATARCIDTINAFFFNIASLLCIVLAFLTTEQVIARYFFSASSVALQELEWHLFGFLILLGMSHTLKRDQHVRVDILYSKFSARSQAAIDCCGLCLFLLPMCLLLIWYGYFFAVDAFAFPSPYPADHWSASYFDRDGAVYSFFARMEALMRNTLLAGEVSQDAGGLSARWIIKASIPFGFLLLLLQGFSQFWKSWLVFICPSETHER